VGAQAPVRAFRAHRPPTSAVRDVGATLFQLIRRLADARLGAPGIAEALFATALGLVAAIPAVIFYNRVSGDIGAYGKRLNAFIGVFEVELSRQLSRKEDRNGLRVA
jgi:hypothetical protein